MYQLTARNLYTPQGVLKDQVIVFDQTIQKILPQKDAKDIDAESLGTFAHVAPGFIDVHIHGSRGADVMDATPEALQTLTSALVENGCTAFLATTMTQTKENIEKALDNVREFQKLQQQDVKGADILGVHLEGPYLSKDKCGAQDPQYILKPTPENAKFLEPYYDLVKLITVAPEEDDNFQMIETWTKQGIVCSMGHTNCDYDTAKAAYEHGLSHVTHCFNAMTGLHHRRPSAVGAALTLPLNCEMIVDGHHLHPAVVSLICKVKPKDQRVLITDAMRAAMQGDGPSELGGQDVYVKNGKATLKDGTIAGSVLQLDVALRNMLDFTDLELDEIIHMLTHNPARILKVDDRKGALKEGMDSDIVCLDEDLAVRRTFVRGSLQFEK